MTVQAPTIIVVDHIAGSRRGQRQELARERVRFGRHPENEVSFDAHRDLDASSRHAELRLENGAYILRDIGSSNGLWVDGAKVSEARLVPGTAADIAFGAAGPRVRVFIGPADRIPEPPSMTATAFRGPSGAGQPGAHTMAMMWRQATAQSSGAAGVRRSTAFMRAFASEAMHHSSRRFKVAMSLVVTLLLAVIGGLLLWQTSERDRMDRDRADDKRRLEQLEREQAIRAETLDSHSEGPGARIAAEYGDAVYVLAVEREDGSRGGFCTGFAVSARHVATNAHCVVEMTRLKSSGLATYALRNGGDGVGIRVVASFKHPRYRGGLSEDVGVVQLASDLPTWVELANIERLQALRKGANIFTLGYPGRLVTTISRGEAPEASIVNGIIGRITDFDGDRADFADSLLVQHNLLTSPGTSGSPVFDGFGKVVAVNAGAYTEARTEVLVDPQSGEQRSFRRDILTPGANYAIRIDALQVVLRDNDIEIPAP